MSFLDNIVNRKVTPNEAAVTGAVAILTLSGDFTELERRLISIFRDEFPALTDVEDESFKQLVEKGIDLVHHQGVAADVNKFVQEYMLPSLGSTDERIAAYRYVYALAMANLNLDEGETTLLDAMKAQFGLDTDTLAKAEADVTTEFEPLHRALAAVVLGFIVVTADGVVQDSELEDLQAARSILEPIARLDDTQFQLVYDLALSIYNRFLIDPDNRLAFLYNIVAPKLNTRDLRVQGFHYAASVAVADGDLAKSEADLLKEILKALQISDEAGQAIFNQYMTKVKTIDGKPIQQ